MPDPQDRGFARLVADSREALSRYVRRLVKGRGAAEDIVQEAFFRNYTRANESCPLQPYLVSIARNLAANTRTHERVVDAANAVNAPFVQGTYESPEDAAVADETLRLLDAAIQSLSPQCRAAFTLRMFQDRSYKE